MRGAPRAMLLSVLAIGACGDGRIVGGGDDEWEQPGATHEEDGRSPDEPAEDVFVVSGDGNLVGEEDGVGEAPKDGRTCNAGEGCDVEVDGCDPAGTGCAGGCGDPNEDGDVDAADVVMCNTLVNGGEPYSCCATFATDFNRDGVVTRADCYAIWDWIFEAGPDCGEAGPS